jgi:hypothetical protein
MHPKLLIDAITRQTTVLIAQLSTSAGLRAPLAHVADQVFVELARELESQGLGKKVVADMFGMALRGYQKKIQRLGLLVGARERTLWETLLDYVHQHQPISRSKLLEHFKLDGEEVVASVVRDLVQTGLLSSTGQGAVCVYRITTEHERRVMLETDVEQALGPMIWATVYHNPGLGLSELSALLNLREEELQIAVAELVASEKLTRTEGRLTAKALLVPVGAESGWEAAVFDHFQAVASAIAAKVRAGTLRSDARDQLGGATLTFDVSAAHPLSKEVLGLLARVRVELNELWNRVHQHNAQSPVAEAERIRVRFYFGQSVIEPE